MKKVILRVDSGLIYLVSGAEHLKGIEIEIRDYDIDGIDEENLRQDEEGEQYFLQEI